jgi:regulatory protein
MTTAVCFLRGEPVRVITALEVQKKNKERVNVYLDGEYAFSLSLIDAARLRKGQSLAEADINALQGQDEIGKAVDRAARFLAYRPRSEQEVRRNLKEKDTVPEVIEAAIERLRTMGYLDDAAFARYWVQNRNEFKPLSPKALRYELRQKGVPSDIIDETLESLEAGDLAYRAAQARVNKLRRSDKRLFRQKLAAFLQQRGFSYTTIREAVERLIEELEAQDPDYFEDEHD